MLSGFELYPRWVPLIYGACMSLLHEGTMRYGSFDPYGPKTYGACMRGDYRQNEMLYYAIL